MGPETGSFNRSIQQRTDVHCITCWINVPPHSPNEDSNSYIHTYMHTFMHTQGFFLTVRAGTAYREMKMRNVHFVC